MTVTYIVIPLMSGTPYAGVFNVFFSIIFYFGLIALGLKVFIRLFSHS